MSAPDTVFQGLDQQTLFTMLSTASVGNYSSLI